MTASRSQINSEFQHIAVTDADGGLLGIDVEQLQVADLSGLTIPGGTFGQAIVTDGAGNLTWANATGGGGTVIAEYGSTSLPGGTTITVPSNGNVDIITFTLPSAGTWEVQYTVRGVVNAATRWVSPFLSDDSTGLEVANSRAICSYISAPTGVVDFQGTATMATNITTTGSAVYKLRAYSNAGGSVYADPAAGGTKVSWKKISGFIPSTGTLQTYAKYTRTTQQTGTLTVGSRVICNVLESSSGSDIQVNTTTGQVTLVGGKTYRLRGMVPNYQTNASTTRPQFCWYNETASSYIGGSSSAYNASDSATYGASGGTAEAIITVSATTIVSFRVLNNSGATLTGLGANPDFPVTGSYPWIDIETMGTSSVAQFVGTLSSVYSSSLSYPTGTIVVKDNMLYQSNGDVAAGTAFTLGTTGATWTQIGFGTITAESGSVTTLPASQSTASTSLVDVTGSTFTLPSAGTWLVTYELSFFNNNGGGTEMVIADVATNTVVTGSRVRQNATTVEIPVCRTVQITTTSATQYKLRYSTAGSGTSFLAADRNIGAIFWNKISGFVPTNGTVTSYGSYRVDARGTGGDYTLTAQQGNMPVVSSTFVTLKANTTYELRASLEIRATYAVFEWATEAGVTLGNSGDSFSANSTDTGSPVPAYAVYTPTVDTRVKLRLTFIANYLQTNVSYGEVSIKQIGTTATAAFTGSITNGWNILNTYAAGTIVVKDGMFYQANGTVNSGTTFVVGTTDGTWSQIGFGSVMAEYGSTELASTLSLVAATITDILSFTLPTPGVWEVTYQVSAEGAAGIVGNVITAWLTDASNNVIDNSSQRISWAGNTSLNTPCTYTVRITTTTNSQIFKLRGRSNAASVWYAGSAQGTDQNTNVIWKKISGFVPSNGTTVEYSSVSGIAAVPASATSPVVPVAITLSGDTRAVGTIPYNTSTGIWTLTAGITYQFELEYVADGATVGVGDVNLAFTDATTSGVGTTRIGPASDARAISVTFSSRILSRPSSYTFVYTPTTNQTVRLSSMFCDGACSVNGFAVIKQIGSTAASGFIGSVTNGWSINNTYASGTIVVRDGMMYQANSTINAGTSFVAGTTGGTWLPLNTVMAENGTNYIIGGVNIPLGISSTTPTPLVNFTLPSAGTWLVTYNTNFDMQGSSDYDNAFAMLRNATNTTTLSGTEQRASMSSAANATFPISASTVVTTTGSTAYMLAGYRANGGTTNGHIALAAGTSVTWTKISGFLPMSAGNEVSGYVNADVVFDTGFGWGLSFSGTDAQFYFKNTSSAAVNVVIMDEYYIDTGSAKSIGQRGKTSIAAGGTSLLWTDTTLTMNGMGDIETGYIIISTGGPGAYALAAFVSKYEYYCSVGAGYNNNYVRVKKVW